MIEAIAFLAVGLGVCLSLYGITMALHGICEQVKRLVDSLPTVPTSGEDHGD